MQAPLSKNVIGCIGKCTSGLSIEELDHITDNINKTLTHPRGRQIFKKYLQRRDLRDNLECLALYESCCKFVDEATSYRQVSKAEPPLEPLIENVTIVKEMAEDLDGVPLIDLAFLRKFNKALSSRSRIDLLTVLVDTRDRCRDHLRHEHESFKKYASEPCPLTK
ncbi:uncharacterized protein LOC143185763 [Calliopsis andreniformis]|uniref:uncharacterized protein LOC143185763 n=1 Tax=Calliopsis andreniformis TaxID=337506 RepID=UPI003FCCB0D2